MLRDLGFGRGTRHRFPSPKQISSFRVSVPNLQTLSLPLDAQLQPTISSQAVFEGDIAKRIYATDRATFGEKMFLQILLFQLFRAALYFVPS